MNKHVVTLVTLGALATFSMPATAQISLMPYVGYNLSAGVPLDAEDEDDRTGAFLVGFGAGFGIPMTGPVNISIVPSLEYLFLPGESFSENGLQFDFSQSRLNLNADVVAEFSTPGTIVPYAGAGLAWTTYRISGEFCFMGECDSASESESGIGLNLLGGIKLGDLGFASPFIQARYTILSIDFDDEFEEGTLDLNALTISVGLSIPVGR